MRHSPTPDAQEESVSAYAERTRLGFKAKAAHNKAESLFCFSIVVFATSATTLFVTLGQGYWFGKVIPAVLSAAATAATAWLQLRRPQHLWELYRGIQREI